MELSQEKLRADIALFEKALGTLESVLVKPLDEITRDAAIQRFEYCFELAWKTLQAASDYMGEPCNSPREAILNIEGTLLRVSSLSPEGGLPPPTNWKKRISWFFEFARGRSVAVNPKMLYCGIFFIIVSAIFQTLLQH